jgi:hypothetical protein
MKNLFSLLIVIFAGTLLFVGCEKESIDIVDDVALETIQQDFFEEIIEEESVVDDAFDKLLQEDEQSINKSSWTRFYSRSITSSSTGYSYFAGLNESYFTTYDFRAVVTSVNRSGAHVATARRTSSGTVYLVQLKDAYQGTDTEILLDQENLRTGDTQGRFYVKSDIANTSYTIDLYFRRKIPSGFSLHSEGEGVAMYEKTSGAGSVYVQRIDLKKASLNFKTSNQNGCYDCRPDYWTPRFNLDQNANSHHNDIRYQSKYFSMINAAFFAPSGSARGSLSFPVKFNSQFISHGHDNGASKRPYTRAFAIAGTRAYTFDYIHGDNISHDVVESSFFSYNHAVVGFEPTLTDLGTTPTSARGRTMVAVDRTKRNIVYFYSASARTVSTAKTEFLNALNLREQEIVMLDAGGSSTLHSKESGQIISGDYRSLPHMIVVYEY